MTGEHPDTNRRREDEIVMEAIILFCTTLVGVAWAGLESGVYTAPFTGGLAGFLAGVALILTARLAKR